MNPIQDQPKWWRAGKDQGSKLGKILIQSRTNLNGGELERKIAKEKGRGRPTHRCEPSVFRVILALHAPGHRSAAALRNALQLATATAPPDHEPSNARFIRLPDPTNGHNNAIQDRLPLLSSDGYAGELLVSHHASSRTPLPAPTARKHCSCFSAANSAFPYAPGSSPNTKRTSRRRSLKPKLHSTKPRRPIASPITVSKSTCQRPLLLTQQARPTPAQAI